LKQNNDVIVFDVNETLYFKKGQEIEEMVSISLDPDIAIQTYDNYIQIRGLIFLQGEYTKSTEQSSEDIANDQNIMTGYIEKIFEKDNHQASFSHRFPVEISVPPYRVDNLEDVTVTIDSFDYEIPDKRTLKIKSSVHINGIKSVTAESVPTTTLAKEEQEEVQQNDKKENEKVKDIEEKIESKNIGENLHEQKEAAQEVIEQKEVERDVVEQKTEDKKVVPFTKVSEDENKEKETENGKNVKEEVEGQGESEITAVESETNEIDIQLNESDIQEDEEKVKDVRFLTELFGSDEEETYSKMRIYITQEEDTIESIAKRYEISALQLMKDNHLTGDNLEEGQLLRLPAKTSE